MREWPVALADDDVDDDSGGGDDGGSGGGGGGVVDCSTEIKCKDNAMNN